MKTAKIKEGRMCPKCGQKIGQMNNGHNRSGTQRRICSGCKNSYTVEPKRRSYPEEIRKLAIKEYLSGVSGRGVGKIHGMSGNNVINWIKKSGDGVDKYED
jgi:transposase-like protein